MPRKIDKRKNNGGARWGVGRPFGPNLQPAETNKKHWQKPVFFICSHTGIASELYCVKLV